MDRSLFKKPVSVLVGLGYPAKVESASQAYRLLSELPMAKENPARSIAAKICKLAMDGIVEPETARSAFITFARRMAMLTGEDAGRNGPPHIPEVVQGCEATSPGCLPGHSVGSAKPGAA
jgi:hypothetical protein